MRRRVCSATPGWPLSAKLAEATETPATRATSRIPPGCCGPPLLTAMMLPGLGAPLPAPDHALSRARKPPTAPVPVTWRRDKHPARPRSRLPGGERRHGVGAHHIGVEPGARLGYPALRREVDEDDAEPLLVAPGP